MAEVIDRAYIEILPDLDAFQGTFSKAMDREVRTSENVVSRGMSRVTQIVAGAALAMTAAVTGAAVAISGISLTRGFARLADIEDAQAKLRGLGHTGESVQTIMDNAMAAVRGTIFGFNDMAGVAASIVGAGIEPGRELERTLKAIADAAQIGGADLAEMGDIIGQVAVAGRASMNEINRMQTRGIPILSWLAEQMGVTAEEARAMVSAGEVSFRDFRQAIEENIAGAALEAANTTRGAWDNMVFTFTRTGAALLSGVFPTFKEVFNGIAEAMAPVEQLANQIGPALGAALDAFRDGGGIRGAIQAFRESLDPEVFSEATSAIRDMVTNGLNYIKDNAADIVGFVLEMRGTVINAILGVAEALPVVAPRIVDGLIDMITSLIQVIVDALPSFVAAAGFIITGLVDGLVAALPDIVTGAVQIVLALVDGIVNLLPIVIGAGLRLIEGLVEGLLVALPQIQAALVQMLPQILNAVTQMTPDLMLLGIRILVNIVDGIAAALPQLIDVFQNEVIPSLLNTIVNEGPRLIEAGGQAVIQLLQGIVDSADLLASAVTDEIIPAFTAMFRDNPGFVDAGTEALITLIRGFTDNITMIVEFVSGTLIPTVTQTLRDNMPALVDAGMLLLEAIIDGMIDAIPELSQAVITQLIPALLQALVESLPQLWAIGGEITVAVLSGLWDAWSSRASQTWGDVRDSVVDAVTSVLDVLRELPGQAVNALRELPGVLANLAEEALYQAGRAIGTGIGVILRFFIELPGQVAEFVAETAAVVGAAVDAIVEFFVDLPGRVTDAITSLPSRVSEIFTTTKDNGTSLVSEFVDSAEQWFRDLPGKVANALASLGPRVWEAFRDAHRRAVAQISEFVSNAVSRFASLVTRIADETRKIPGRILSALSGIRTLLVGAGRDLIQGFLDGIRSQIPSIDGLLSGITNRLPDWKGPPEIDRAILRDSGRLVMQGFQAGIQDERGNIERLLRGITTDIGSVGAFTGRVQGSSGTGQVGSRVVVENVTITITGQGREAGERAAEAFMERLAQSVLVR